MVTSSGVRIRLRSTSPAGLEALLGRLPGQWRSSTAARVARTYSFAPAGAAGGGAPAEHVLYCDAAEHVRSADLDWALAVYASSAGFYVGSHSVRRTFVHAGSVGWRGHAIVIPGMERTGKTTLTAALVRAGATYLSDEYAPIDDRGRVDPFPRPLSFKRAGDRPELRPVESLGGTQGTRPLPVGLVVVAPYRGLERWRPRRVAPGRGLLYLLENCLSAQTRPQHAFERLGRVVTAAPVLKGGRGDADETAPLILARLELELGLRS